jgi:hypothetical protein
MNLKHRTVATTLGLLGMTLVMMILLVELTGPSHAADEVPLLTQSPTVGAAKQSSTGYPDRPHLDLLDAKAVAVSGSLAYVGFDSHLLVLDISNATFPEKVAGPVVMTHPIQDIEAQGGYLYIALDDGGLQIVSISTPTNPVKLGFTTEITPVSNVVVSGDYAYVAGGDLGIISVADPANPSLIGTYDTQGGWSYNVDVQGDYAYLVENAFKVISVETPTLPTLVSSLNTTMPYYVDVQGDYAYLSDYIGGFKVISITNPASPTVVANGAPGLIHRLSISGTYAYACSSFYGTDNRFYISSVSDPITPTIVGMLPLSSLCNNLDIQGQYAYVATREGLRIIAIDDPEQPVGVGSYPVPPAAVAIAGAKVAVVSSTYTFTATTTPLAATTPITYVWHATGQPPVTNTASLSDVATFAWSTPELQFITVTATNLAGTVTETRAITIGLGTTVEPIVGGVLVYTDTQGNPTIVQVPAGAVSAVTDLVYTPIESVTAPAGFAFAGHAFGLDAYRNGMLLSGLAFSVPVTVIVHYSEADIVGLDETSLVLTHWNDGSGTWEDAACGQYVRHLNENWLSMPICHLSRLAVWGRTADGQHTVYLPLVVRNR